VGELATKETWKALVYPYLKELTSFLSVPDEIRQSVCTDVHLNDPFRVAPARKLLKKTLREVLERERRLASQVAVCQAVAALQGVDPEVDAILLQEPRELAFATLVADHS
jgi:hypothetical protein